MQWTRPEFQEITLGMEVTAYVNTDDLPKKQEPRRGEAQQPAAPPQDPAA